jgi:hypothetical protein
VIITKVPHSCAYEVSDIVGDRRIAKTYYGFIRSEAVADFIAFVRYTEDPSYTGCSN